MSTSSVPAGFRAPQQTSANQQEPIFSFTVFTGPDFKPKKIKLIDVCKGLAIVAAAVTAVYYGIRIGNNWMESRERENNITESKQILESLKNADKLTDSDVKELCFNAYMRAKFFEGTITSFDGVESPKDNTLSDSIFSALATQPRCLYRENYVPFIKNRELLIDTLEKIVQEETKDFTKEKKSDCWLTYTIGEKIAGSEKHKDIVNVNQEDKKVIVNLLSKSALATFNDLCISHETREQIIKLNKIQRVIWDLVDVEAKEATDCQKAKCTFSAAVLPLIPRERLTPGLKKKFETSCELIYK